MDSFVKNVRRKDNKEDITGKGRPRIQEKTEEKMVKLPGLEVHLKWWLLLISREKPGRLK